MKRARVDSDNVLTLYTDGAAKGNGKGAAGWGVYIDSDRFDVQAFGDFLGDSGTTCNVAEYTAIIEALEWARQQRPPIRCIELYSDSNNCVQQLNGAFAVNSGRLRPLFDRTNALLKHFEQVRFHHVPRERNTKADSMANRAIRLRRRVVDERAVELPPPPPPPPVKTRRQAIEEHLTRYNMIDEELTTELTEAELDEPFNEQDDDFMAWSNDRVFTVERNERGAWISSTPRHPTRRASRRDATGCWSTITKEDE